MIKLGIIGAMTIEIETLKEKMENIQLSCRTGMEFCEGTLEGLPVVVVQCGVGKVVATSDLGVKDPLYYFILKNVSPDPQRYWSNDFKLDTSADSYPWNYSIAAHMQYDPCPAGYKLPSVAVMKGALSAYTWSNVVSADMTHPDGLYSETDGEFRYIPGGGYRQGYGLFLPFKGASGSTKHTSCHFLCSTLSNGADDHNRAYIGVTGSHSTGSSKWETGNGAQVRCVKE